MLTYMKKKRLANVIKDHELENSSGMIQVGPKYNHSVFIKRKLGDVMMEARGWSDLRKSPQAKECGKPPETRKGKDIFFPLEPPGKSRLY